jgi:S1-C subfamily serine protease
MAISQTISTRGKSALVGLVALLLITLAGAAQTSESPPRKGRPVQRKRADLTPESRARIRQAVSAVGLILVRTSPDASQPARPRGSAVIVRKDGLVATNYHVIFDNRSGRLFSDLYLSLPPNGPAFSLSFRHRIKPVLINKEYDLALLRIESETAGKEGSAGPFRAVTIGDSKSVQLLDDLFIIGFPEKGGLDVTVNRGSVEGKDILGHWIKTDGRMIHGNSGGAAVNNRGELIGIPTKVIADSQPVDRDGDGFPEDVRVFGAVGFVRPAHLISAMLGELDSQGARKLQVETPAAVMMAPALVVTIRGVAKSSLGGKPIAGALVGLLPQGITEVTENTLLTWGSANADGEFVLNKPVPPGLYTLRAKALGYDLSMREIRIDEKGSPLVVELQPSSAR